ncbi:b157 [miniopterid betaherpesvirus 1]|uniref:B157 n=1 Tax=miniopterid betaherpesvirus 1 TaxID=3070189 RepID=I3VQF9_9BETA|nr:b157 [miniopterid betaherpesvirus 1]AFK84003.1 b157 [miniopterid betaherpesvirus 1]
MDTELISRRFNGPPLPISHRTIGRDRNAPRELINHAQHRQIRYFISQPIATRKQKTHVR